MLDQLKIKLTIPGLLFIDTPGHAAFTNLRKRGGSMADIAILVVDINEGFMPQTEESIEILKHNKTPFIIAASKVDKVPGWRSQEGGLLQDIANQSENVKQDLDNKLYSIVGKLSEMGINSERFDRVEDYTQQVAIVPYCAKTGEGIPELLMVLTGLAQKYLEKGLEYNDEGPAKGTILEIKEDKGLGKTLDVIIYDGILRVGDTIVIGGIDKPIVSKVKALFEPMPLEEMMVKKSKFDSVNEVTAATGVKISAPGIENAVAGMPLAVAHNDLEDIKREVQSSVENILVLTDELGIIVKADSLGSLEALITLLREKGVEIRKASIGEINKKDLAEAQANYDQDHLKGVILGFNVGLSKEIKEAPEKIKVISSDIIYKLIDGFEAWQEQEKKNLEQAALGELTRPFKLEFLRNHTFRQSSPAVIGVEVLVGKAKAGKQVMNKDGKVLSKIKSMQAEQETVSEAEKGKQLAVSLLGVTVGRQINEGDIFYSSIPENDFRKLKEFKKYLSKEEITLLKEIAEIMRKQNYVWGV